MLSEILPQHKTIEEYEVEHTFEHIGRKVMRLNARKTVRPGNGSRRILLAIEDVTESVDATREAARTERLTRGIVDTIREPLLVLDGNLTVITASRSFFSKFGVSPDETINRRIWELGDGQWSIPELIHLLTTIIPAQSEIENYEVNHDFPGLGPRTLLLNARKILREGNNSKALLLAMEDVTDRRRIEREREAALTQANELLEEVNHRVMNSLTMITSIIAVESRAMENQDAARAFDRLKYRVNSVASLYRKLSANRSIETVDAAEYLGAILEDTHSSLGRSNLALKVHRQIDPVDLTTETAVPLGLVVNEVVTNCMKYAFQDRPTGEIGIHFSAKDDLFDLTIWDDGIGVDKNARVDSGMVQRLVAAFTKQLAGQSRVESDSSGTKFLLSMPRPREDSIEA